MVCSEITDALAYMQAAIKALKEREAALLTLHAIEADLEKRRHAVALLDSEAQKVYLLLTSHSLSALCGTHIKA